MRREAAASSGRAERLRQRRAAVSGEARPRAGANRSRQLFGPRNRPIARHHFFAREIGRGAAVASRARAAARLAAYRRAACALACSLAFLFAFSWVCPCACACVLAPIIMHAHRQRTKARALPQTRGAICNCLCARMCVRERRSVCARTNTSGLYIYIYKPTCSEGELSAESQTQCMTMTA